MATAKRTASKAKTTSTKRSGTAGEPRTSPAKKRSTTHPASGSKAHKTRSKTAHGQAWTDKHSDHPSSTGQGKAKKQPAKQTSHCWPGFEPVPGTKPGEKGSCKPKAHQTASEKKSDAMAAAANKLHKARGSKAAASRTR